MKWKLLKNAIIYYLDMCKIIQLALAIKIGVLHGTNLA